MVAMATSRTGVALADIEQAARSIGEHVHRTPVMSSAYFDALAGRDLLFKSELLQKTGSFKARGLLNAVLRAKSQGAAAVVTHSSGNAGQALTWAAGRVGIEAIVVVPESAPAVKKAAIAGYGATVVMCETQAMREPTADRLVRERGGVFVHPSDDLGVISGNGTVGLELVEQARLHWVGQEMDAVIVPVGGGGLIGGIASAVKALLPSCKVFGAEPANADDAFRSKAAGRILQHERPPDTIADGLKTVLGQHTFPIVDRLVDEIFLVEEPRIAAATRAVWERMKLAIEPSAGVGVAVAVSPEFRERYPELRRVGVILCGGNVDLGAMAAVIAAAEPLEQAAAPMAKRPRHAAPG